MKKYILAFVISMFICNSAFAMQDTPENRKKEADRYLLASPPKDMFQDIATQMALNMLPEQQEPFKKVMTKYMDIDAVTKSIKEAMVRIFSADELAALADFYGSPVGVSATKKMGVYMAELMPLIETETLKAVEKAEKEMTEAEEKIKAEPAK